MRVLPCCAIGSSMHARVPHLGLGRMVKLPRWLLALSVASASPRPAPVPAGFVVKNGSAARATCSAAIPTPSSVTTNATRSASVRIVLALMAAGQGFSITALMGILMVIGIAVSNGILLVDDGNRRLNEGVDKHEAIAAARSRFVPIAMTSLATVIGLIPTAMGLELGSEANQPLALAVVGGLTSSTLLSLFLVPVMFLFFARRDQEPTRG